MSCLLDDWPAEGARVELARGVTRSRFSRAVPPPIGWPFLVVRIPSGTLAVKRLRQRTLPQYPGDHSGRLRLLVTDTAKRSCPAQDSNPRPPAPEGAGALPLSYPGQLAQALPWTKAPRKLFPCTRTICQSSAAASSRATLNGTSPTPGSRSISPPCQSWTNQQIDQPERRIGCGPQRVPSSRGSPLRKQSSACSYRTSRWQDSNLRSPPPEGGALAKLGYISSGRGRGMRIRFRPCPSLRHAGATRF